MSLDLLLNAITYLWVALALVWLITAVRLKKIQERQAVLPRALHVFAIVLAFVLMFDAQLPHWLNHRILPQSAPIVWTALVLTLAGIAIAVWARFVIGSNWSGSITLKEEHSLIRSGPYRRVRHPIYSGLVLAMFGTALAEGRVRGFCGAAIMLIAFLIKARSEDDLMRRTFGAAHDAYREHTGTLLPKLR